MKIGQDREYYLLCKNCGNWKKFSHFIYGRQKFSSMESYNAITDNVTTGKILKCGYNIDDIDDWFCWNSKCSLNETEEFDSAKDLLEYYLKHINKKGKYRKKEYKIITNKKIMKLLMVLNL